MPPQSSTTEPVAEIRRAGWRQRLVEVERGLAWGLRGDGTLFADVFLALILIAIGSILRLSDPQWIVLVMAITWLLVTELLRQAFAVVAQGLASVVPRHQLDRARQLAAAAVGIASLGGGLVVVLVFVQRCRDLFS